MEIPDQYVGWAGAVGALFLGWVLRVEAALLGRPTRREQERIAATVAEGVKDQFAEIKRMLEKQNENTALNRTLVADSLAEIRTKVAVLRDRAGDDPLGDTGAHRRRL